MHYTHACVFQVSLLLEPMCGQLMQRKESFGLSVSITTSLITDHMHTLLALLTHITFLF